MPFLALLLVVLSAAATEPGDVEGPPLPPGWDFEGPPVGPALEAPPDGASSDASFAPPPVRRREYPDEVITRVEVAVDRARPDEEEELVRYLSDLEGEPATAATADVAEARLLRVGRYRAAVCRLWTSPKHKGRLRCGLSRARTIRRVYVEGLPFQLLETDLRKRVFLRAGEILDQKDAGGRDRVTRQRVRIEEYLDRLGYSGAKVEVLTPPVSAEADVDVEIRITGGRFVYVHDVEVDADGPVDEDAIKTKFKRLCLNVDGSLEAIERLTFACVTRERLLAAREELEGQLRHGGYPEARVSVDKRVVDPLADASPVVCRASPREIAAARDARIPVAPRCASVRVKIRQGPHLITRLVVERPPRAPADLRVIDDRARAPILPWLVQPVLDLVGGFFRSARALLIEPGSRAIQVLVADDVDAARDTIVYLSELESALTFADAASVDDDEIEESRRRLLAALAERGRLLADVEVERVERDGEVRVTFRIRPGPPVAVGRVHFVGNATFSEEELREAVPLSAATRGVTSTGFVGRADLDDDAERLIAFYESQGFREANVSVETFLTAQGAAEIHFFIEEGERFTLGELVVEGGIDALLPDVLGAIAHCRNGAAQREGRPARVPADCKGAPFRPEEFEADRTRVLNVYVARGYPYTRVDVMPDFNEQGAVVRVRIGSTLVDDAGEGPPPPPPPVALGEVFIDGNDKTDRGVMLRELALSEDALEPVEIAAGLSRLRRTGLYNKVALDYIGVEERDDTVHLRVQVEERPSLTYDTSLAFSTNRLFSLRNEVRERNLLGRMLDLNLLADLGLFVGRYSIIEPELRWPRLFGWPFWLKVTPAVIYEDRPGASVPRVPSSGGATTAIAGWAADDLRRRNLKLLNKLAIEWRPPTTDLTVGLDYELRFEWDDPSGKSLDPLSLEPLVHFDGLVDVIQVTPLRVSTLTPRVSFRDLDNPFDPGRGVAVDASLRMGSPLILNEEWLAIPQGSVAGYWSFNRVTLAGRVRAWTAYSYGPPRRRSSALQQDLVAVGGDRSVRGYLQDRIGVVDLPTRAALGEDVTVDGHLAVFGAVTNLEVRYTLVRGLFLGDLKVAAFADAGVVTHNDRALLDPELASSILLDSDRPRLGVGLGVGARYVLPVGPVAVDAACSPLPRPANEQCAFHLQLGYAF